MRVSKYAIALLCAAAALAQPVVPVQVEAVRAVLKDGSTVVSVPVRSALAETVPAELELEWLVPYQEAGPVAPVEVSIRPGANTFAVPLPLPASSIWLRLRYKLTPAVRAARAFAPQTGIVAVTQMAAHVFELNLSMAERPRPGAPLRVQAQAVPPVTRALVEGLTWSARLELDSGILPARIEKKAGGFVEAVADVPADAENDGRMVVTAVAGDFEQSAVMAVDFPQSPTAQVQTDKPIYQPGQTIHFRAIVLDRLGRAAAGRKVRVTVEDDDGTRLYRKVLTSSRLGIIHEDWPLPESVALGPCSIRLALDEDPDEELARQVVRVSRYELPKFEVTAVPDRSAYAPGEEPRVTVTGRFLFGRPVPKGHVKIARNDSDDTETEGDAGEDGSFTARLNVAKDWEKLRDRRWQRFRDVLYVASYTDPVSRRTESRRFEVRLTLEPIHIYLMEGTAGTAFVTTSYADGRPAVSTVRIKMDGGTRTVKTNRFGVASFEAPESNSGGTTVSITATDMPGLTGHYDGAFNSLRATCMIQSARTLHGVGDAVELTLTADAGVRSVLVRAVAGGRTLASQTVPMVNGKGAARFAYQPEFRGVVVFAGWAPGDHQRGNEAQTAVLFPESGDVQLTVQPGRPEYRPGEQASLRVTARTRDGRPVEAAVGLAVVDQAVMERARTDEEFGQRRWFRCAFCGGDAPRAIAGITISDLTRGTAEQFRDSDLDLLGAALLSETRVQTSADASESLTAAPKFKAIESVKQTLTRTLDEAWLRSMEFPGNEADLVRLLHGWSALRRDPWDRPYRTRFGYNRTDAEFDLESAGPDGRFDTGDDVAAGHFARPYILPLRRVIESILAPGHDLPADVEGVRARLAANGVRLETLRDPWGTAYGASVRTEQRFRTIVLSSAGPDRAFRTPDDFVAISYTGTYFDREEEELRRGVGTLTPVPSSVAAFEEAMRQAGLGLDRYKDAWGRTYHVVRRDSAQYEDRRSDRIVQVYGQEPRRQFTSTPITRRYVIFSLRSDGADGQPDTFDDFDVVTFPYALPEETKAAAAPKPGGRPGKGNGEIAGLVTDATGSWVAKATVLLATPSGAVLRTVTGSRGAFSFPGLAAGVYELTARANGFSPYVLTQIPVRAGVVTQCDLTLQVGSVSETVNLNASPVPLQTESASVASAQSASTPRVRDYFPETLLWVPELTTGLDGRASAEFPLADSVTTWMVAAVASTAAGQVVESETSLRAFQPFFLDFDPPAVLTEGDRVELPVTVRNYLKQGQTVELAMLPNDWAALDGPARRSVTVAANGAATATFPLVAKAAPGRVAQRVSATGGAAEDAIEKTASVHPDGQRTTQTIGDLVAGRTTFSVTIPPQAVAAATRSELRLYPNVIALLAESASALMSMPTGCAEQTTSTAYANLVVLRLARSAGTPPPALEQTARKNIAAAMAKLPSLVGGRGGMSYWGGGEGDVALTAYVLDFLLAASAEVAPPEDMAQSLVDWLEKEQRADGLWGGLDNLRTPLVTAQAAAALAAAQKAGLTVKPAALAGAYHALAEAADSTQEPYLMALFVQAALDSGNDALLQRLPERLVALAHAEGTGRFWDLKANTPFYGWGAAGRVETTAVVMSALAAWRARHPQTPGLEEALRGGLQFLVRHRDALGGWLSTQATVRAMRAVVDTNAALGLVMQPGGSVGVRVNGQAVRTVALPAKGATSSAIVLDLSAFVHNGENVVELVSDAGRANALARVTTTHWVPWATAAARSEPELRLAVTFDRTQARPGESVSCQVQAERVGHRGYGMMIAEAGLPPGAEVDRTSLQDVLDDGAAGVDHFEVQPDRVVFYLWPEAGGSSFAFAFTPRLAMTAKSAASVLYDYYNPEARVEEAPVTFTVR